MRDLRCWLLSVSLAVISLAACAPSGSGDSTGASTPTLSPATVATNGSPAVWRAENPQILNPETTKFTALVSRLACNNGVTGDVIEPSIQWTRGRVVVTFAVTPGSGAANCQSNNPVRYEVDLGEPLGDRALIDGRCLPGGETETTALCDSSERSF